MLQKIILFFLLCFPLWTIASGETLLSETNASEINYEINIFEEIESEISKQVSMNTPYSVNLKWLEEKLKIIYPDITFQATWDITGAKSQDGFEFKRTFQEKGVKEISLTIYKIIDKIDENGKKVQEKETLHTKKYELLVYEKSIALILSQDIKKSEIENYIQFSKTDGIYIYQIGPLNKTDIELTSILTSIQNYKKIPGLKSDYVAIWWDRDFIFDILSKLNREAQSDKELLKNKLKIIGISPYNIEILQNYLGNFLAKKDWIEKLLLIREDGKYLILKQNQIDEFKGDLEKNQHVFIDVDLENKGINHVWFISNFVNNLSNIGYTTDSIYILLILPLILAGISFFKHFVWFSPIGVLIPLFITIMFFKIGYLTTLGLIFIYIVINLILSIIIDRYNLLYTPKISFLLTLNIVLLILILNILYSFHLIPIDLNDILYFVVFIVISEKLINILVSKDLSEYKSAFFYTILISSICFAILNLSAIKLLILSYPELILLLIPTIFLMGRFTWLRITEYFRFKEIIKSVEEE